MVTNHLLSLGRLVRRDAKGLAVLMHSQSLPMDRRSICQGNLFPLPRESERFILPYAARFQHSPAAVAAHTLCNGGTLHIPAGGGKAKDPSPRCAPVAQMQSSVCE